FDNGSFSGADCERYLPCAGSGLVSKTKLTIVVGDRQFSEEKMLLVQSCDYFQALYRSGMKECQQEEIHLKSLRAQGFLLALAVYVERSQFWMRTTLWKPSNVHLWTYGSYHAAALFIRDMYTDLEVEVKKTLPLELISYVESLTPMFSWTICYLNETGNTWKVLTDLPLEASTSMAGVTVLDNKLFIIGGIHGIHKQVVESCFCYSVESNSWSRIPSTAQLRYNLSLMGLNGHLYAIGGEYERTVMSSVEIYNIKNRKWTFAANLPRRIFVCLWRPMETTEIYEYASGKNEWQLVTTLIRHQSYGHCMVGHRDNLFIMRNGPSDDFLRCLIDCYNLSLGQWSSLPGHFANSRGSLVTAVVRGDSVFTLNRSMTLEYIVEGKTWKPRRQMKGFPRSGSVWTFLLQLPKALSLQ
uniref:Kelch repeat and BTB domain containing 13b n=1 Tax=Oreochromis niloticus TaxID=8128 RepID=A0A669DWY7_ORENI